MKRKLAPKSSPLCAVPNGLANPFGIIPLSVIRHLIRVALVNTSCYPQTNEWCADEQGPFVRRTLTGPRGVSGRLLFGRALRFDLTVIRHVNAQPALRRHL